MRRVQAPIFLMVITLLVIGLCVACGGKASSPVMQPTASPQSQLVSPAQFATAVATPGTVTLNVLGPGAESIRGTDLFISVDQLATSGDLPPLSTRLAVYCAHGRTSAVAVPILYQLGYRHIIELKGGMAAWAAAGRLLVAPEG